MSAVTRNLSQVRPGRDRRLAAWGWAASLLAHVAVAGGAIYGPRDWLAVPREPVSLASRSGTIVIQASWSAAAPPVIVAPQPMPVAEASSTTYTRDGHELPESADIALERRLEVLHKPELASVPVGDPESPRPESTVDRTSSPKFTEISKATARRRIAAALEIPRASLIATLPSESGAQAREAARFLNNYPPQYPVLALQNRWSGTVWLRLWIDDSGKVTKAQVEHSSGYSILDSAALDAVLQWRAAPARHMGRAIASVEVQPIVFLPRRS